MWKMGEKGKGSTQKGESGRREMGGRKRREREEGG
jgi:hypothetical protein